MKTKLTNLPLPVLLLELALPELQESPTSEVSSVVSLKLLVSSRSSEDSVVERSDWGGASGLSFLICQVMSKLPTSITSITDNSCAVITDNDEM